MSIAICVQICTKLLMACSLGYGGGGGGRGGYEDRGGGGGTLPKINLACFMCIVRLKLCRCH